jgi:hypothetical protein
LDFISTTLPAYLIIQRNKKFYAEGLPRLGDKADILQWEDGDKAKKS